MKTVGGDPCLNLPVNYTQKDPRTRDFPEIRAPAGVSQERSSSSVAERRSSPPQGWCLKSRDGRTAVFQIRKFNSEPSSAAFTDIFPFTRGFPSDSEYLQLRGSTSAPPCPALEKTLCCTSSSQGEPAGAEPRGRSQG